MSIPEKIQEQVQKLPASLQAEVLHFIEYLLNKEKQQLPRTRVLAVPKAKTKYEGLSEYLSLREKCQEEQDWAELSLAFAMQGMKDEETPVYTTADLKVVFV